ncbi:Sushi, nidogen and EGF-like domain-containing protein 1 [Araneus ventricosus]|uniref:Sushi, nidogen and EGF-like domain-containing protein 1 n=1 Tax=Araneus ventricosus TaxID=182803 RepID=A0A4Y2PJ53_ARAVE|nr:Sushi, nidogen and EGF-like domain-containing protein 1 [Araneus ventricosus]
MVANDVVDQWGGRCPKIQVGVVCRSSGDDLESAGVGLCSLYACENGGSCEIVDDKPRCKCNGSYTGEHCDQDACHSSPCLNGGICNVENGNVMCFCQLPFSGERCEKDPCTEHLCENNGVCSPGKDGTRICNCSEPFFGENCEKDPCSSNPCKNNSKCKINGTNYVCVCDEHLTEDMCQEGILPKTCDSRLCLNGGTCQIADDGFNCSCTEEYYGDTCEKRLCIYSPCKNGGTCIVQNGKNICSCEEPYKGDHCEESPCEPNPCRNGGQCKIEDHEFKCRCLIPHIGKFCEEAEENTSFTGKNENITDSPVNSNDLDIHEATEDTKTTSESSTSDVPCSPNPCQNNGTCRIDEREEPHYECNCLPTYMGVNCEQTNMETPTYNISRNSGNAKILNFTFDSCTMSHKAAFEALDVTLKNIRCNNNRMGGITMVVIFGLSLFPVELGWMKCGPV